jgi:hypothetical protein
MQSFAQRWQHDSLRNYIYRRLNNLPKRRARGLCADNWLPPVSRDKPTRGHNANRDSGETQSDVCRLTRDYVYYGQLVQLLGWGISPSQGGRYLRTTPQIAASVV